MKKLFVLALIAIAFLSTYHKGDIIDYSDSLNYDATVKIYSYSPTRAEGYDSLNNCGTYITTTNRESARLVINNTADVIGVSLIFNGSVDKIDSYLSALNAVIVSREEISGIVIIYAYSRGIKDSVVVNNQKVNIQIAVKKGVVTIGSPVIIGSY